MSILRTEHSEKGLFYITRKEHFNAAHKLYVAAWSLEQNLEVFGKCANANWHGHNFTLFVTIKGKPDPITGFVMNLKELSKMLKHEVVDQLDHQNLNLDVPWLVGIQPSIENIIAAIWNRLADKLPDYAALHQIRLVETENNFVDYFG